MILTHIALLGFLSGAGGAVTCSASAAITFAPPAVSIVVQTPPRTMWINIDVPWHPGSIWDGGASAWDGGDDAYDNDGAIWDPTSRFGADAVPATAWTAQQVPATTWLNSLR
jgi:hypothetical protein